MSMKTLSNNGLTWIHFDVGNEETLQYLKREYTFHPLDLEDVAAEQQTPKIDIYKNYLFIVLLLPFTRDNSQTIAPNEINLFVGDNYVITIQSTKSKETNNLFSGWLSNPATKTEWMKLGSGYLLYSIIEALFENARPVRNSIGKKISVLENEIFETDPHSGIIRELSFHRRNVLNFRRTLDPERQTIPHIYSQKSFLGPDLHVYFDDINDTINNMWTIINTYKDTLDTLHSTVESLINRKTSKIITTLTVISVALLPLNLFASIYGMNIPGLPFAHSPVWVWIIFGVLSAVVATFAIIMRREKWL